MPYRNLSFENP